MNLENRCAYWVDLGITSYQSTYELQKQLVFYRKQDFIPDIILATQHFPEITFGASQEYNLFSDKFINEIKEARGNNYTQKDVVDILFEKGIAFSYSDRGGGAALFAPGQLIYYPIAKHSEITGKELDISIYKNKIYQILFETLKNLGIEGINLTTDQSYSNKKDRKDVWINRNGKTLKMGSKGIKIEGKVAYYGFALYIDKKGLEHSWIINTCGYSPEEVSLISVEEELGRKIPHEEVHNNVKDSIAKNFGYNSIINLSQQELNYLINKKEAVA